MPRPPTSQVWTPPPSKHPCRVHPPHRYEHSLPPKHTPHSYEYPLTPGFHPPHRYEHSLPPSIPLTVMNTPSLQASTLLTGMNIPSLQASPSQVATPPSLQASPSQVWTLPPSKHPPHRYEHPLPPSIHAVSTLLTGMKNQNKRWGCLYHYRSGTVNSKSFVGKDFLRIKWKFDLNYAL